MPRVASATLNRVADQLARLPEGTMRTVSGVVIGIAYDEARRSTGDGRMSGIGRRGAKLRAVATRPQLRGPTVTMGVQGVPVGAWSMLTSGAVPHEIRPRRRGGPGVMAGSLAPGGVATRSKHPTSRPVMHPGMRGNLAWKKVKARAAREVPPLFADAVHRAVR